MSDRAALLAAICAHPDEDTPRLVYADWLQENGEAKRAAFIRAQIEDYRQENADTAANAVSDFLYTQYAAGLDRIKWAKTNTELGAALVARAARQKRRFHLTLKGEGVPKLKGVSFKNHARGFFDFLVVESPGEFLEHADEIFRSAPISGAEFEFLNAEQAQELVDGGYLSHFRELVFGPEVEPEAIRVLGAHKDAGAVRKMTFEISSAEGTTLEALADGRHWSGLEYFDIDDAEDAEDPPESGQVAELLGRRQFRGLRKLTAWGSNLDDDVLKAIAKNLPELRFLDVALNEFTGDGFRALANSKTLRNLRTLDLSSCGMDDGAAAATLLTSAALPNLTVLRLDGNEIGNIPAKVLAKPGRGPGLRVLDLGHVRLNAAAVEALAKCPALRGLWYLEFQPDTPDSLACFFQQAAFERLTYLDMSVSGMDADDVTALAAWPGAASLQGLDLSGNSIGEKGAKALANSPHLTGLKYLHTTGRGVALLKKRFKKVFE